MSTAEWIWINSDTSTPNQYIQFRREFTISSLPTRACLRVCIDTNFAAFVNGHLVGCGQWQDFPDTPKYSEIDITRLLRLGTNSIAILGYYCGEGHFSYLAGKARLWFECLLDDACVAVSDTKTIARRDPAFVLKGVSRITPQRGFTFNYDARCEERWADGPSPEHDHWQYAIAVDNAPAPQARPVPMHELKPAVAGKIVAQGVLRRIDDGQKTFAELMQCDFLSARRSWELFANFSPISSPAPFPITIDSSAITPGDGAYLVIDLGREECGHLSLELEATGMATLDIAIGEHLDDLRVRSYIGGRNFTSRYVAGVGKRTFDDHLNRNAGRYIQVHITGLTGALTFHRISLIPAEYPIQEKITFECDDALVKQIWQTARRTLHLCMHEHFEDCPAREQALYANDSRSQMLCNYHVFGDYAFARASLDLLGRSVGEDGYLELCAPMRCPITIPSFTMTWFLAMHDYLKYSGDCSFIVSWFPAMKRMMSRYFESLVQDLLPCPFGERYWHFYDWADGLDGTEANDCTRFAVADKQRLDAPLNLLFAMALAAMSSMAKAVEDHYYASVLDDQLVRLRAAIARKFCDQQSGLFQTYSSGETKHFAELTQSLAILARVGSETEQAELRRKLMSASNGMTPTTLSQSLYKFEALLIDPSCRQWVREAIVRDWSAMLFAGATSFWETRNGGWDFHHAGSLCHGWSAIPVYLFGAYELGVL